MKTNKQNLEELIHPHTQYWDCYNDCPLEYNHTGKVVKIASEFAVSFSVFCAENCLYTGDDFWTLNDKVGFLTTKEVLKIYLKQKQE